VSFFALYLLSELVMITKFTPKPRGLDVDVLLSSLRGTAILSHPNIAKRPSAMPRRVAKNREKHKLGRASTKRRAQRTDQKKKSPLELTLTKSL